MSKIVVEMSGDEAKLFQSFQKIIDQQVKMSKGMKDYDNAAGKAEMRAQKFATSLKKSQEAHTTTFGSGAIGQLVKYAAGVASITSALSAANEAFRRFEETQKRAASGQRGSRTGLAQLAQLTDDPKEYAKLVRQAKQTFAEGGAASLGEAGQFVFDLNSAGLGDQRGLFSRLKSTGLVDDTGGLARSIATLQTSIGKGETGNARDLINKALGASKGSPAQAQVLLEAAARGGTGAAALGLSDEDLLAATTVLSKSSGSAEVGGTQVAALLKQLDKAKGEQSKRGEVVAGLDVDIAAAEAELGGISVTGSDKAKARRKQESIRKKIERLKGKRTETLAAPTLNFEGQDLSGLVGQIGGLVDSGVNIRDVLGDRQEAINAFRVLRSEGGKDEFRSNLANINQGLAADSLGKKFSLLESVPEFQAARQAQQAEAKRQLGEEFKFGTTENLADAIQNELISNARRDGINEAGIQGLESDITQRRGRGGVPIASSVPGLSALVRGGQALGGAGNEALIRDVAAGETPGVGVDVEVSKELRAAAEAWVEAADRQQRINRNAQN